VHSSGEDSESELPNPAFQGIPCPNVERLHYLGNCVFSGCSTHFFDYDNDGWKDFFVTQGHVMDTNRACGTKLEVYETSVDAPQ